MVYLFLADGFEEIEALTPLDYLRRCDIEIKSVGITGKTVTGSHGIQVAADLLPEQVDLTKADMIVLPGGIQGATTLGKSGAVQDSIDYCLENDRYIAAICFAPTILGDRGFLAGKKVTCFPGHESHLTGAEIMKPGVYRDGKIITATSVHFAGKFSYALVEALLGAPRVEQLKSMVVDR